MLREVEERRKPLPFPQSSGFCLSVNERGTCSCERHASTELVWRRGIRWGHTQAQGHSCDTIFFRGKNYMIPGLCFKITHSGSNMEEMGLTKFWSLQSWVMNIMSSLYNSLYLYVCLEVSINLFPHFSLTNAELLELRVKVWYSEVGARGVEDTWVPCSYHASASSNREALDRSLNLSEAQYFPYLKNENNKTYPLGYYRDKVRLD